MKAMCSLGTRGRPTLREVERRRQNSLKPWRCQAITVFPCRGHGGCDDDQGTFPARPELPENDPEGTVLCPEPNTPLSPLVDGELLSQGGVLDGQGRPRQEGGPNETEQGR